MPCAAKLEQEICLLQEQLSFIVIMLNEKGEQFRKICKHPSDTLHHVTGRGPSKSFAICGKCNFVVTPENLPKKESPASEVAQAFGCSPEGMTRSCT